MNEEALVKYYVKFNEHKRLTTKHSQVEFQTALKYIHECLENNNGKRILDVGAGTGRYSVLLADEGYDVTAVELVKHNLRVIEKSSDKVKAFLGNALDLSRFEDNSFDIVLLFGPMYHLISEDDKIKAMQEAYRVCAPNGYILVSYCMNEYAIMSHGFVENHIKESAIRGALTRDYHVVSKDTDLYSYVRLEDINRVNEGANVKRHKIVNQDGFAEYNKKLINEMDEDAFNHFLNYHFSICERPELLGFGRHILDIIKKEI